MSSDLNLAEATAIAKLAEKEIKRCKDAGETLTPGAYPLGVTVEVDGTMSKAVSTTAAQSFMIDKFLKALMLKYAESLGTKEGREWLNLMLSPNQAMGLIIKVGPQKVLDMIPAELIAVWEVNAEQAKTLFHQTAERVDREGSTVVAGDLRVAERRVVAAKRK
jgi:hypothetical protein